MLYHCYLHISICTAALRWLIESTYRCLSWFWTRCNSECILEVKSGTIWCPDLILRPSLSNVLSSKELCGKTCFVLQCHGPLFSLNDIMVLLTMLIKRWAKQTKENKIARLFFPCEVKLFLSAVVSSITTICSCAAKLFICQDISFVVVSSSYFLCSCIVNLFFLSYFLQGIICAVSSWTFLSALNFAY